MNSLTVNAPLNSVSFGNVSFNILKEIFLRNILNLQYFPIGNIDIGSFVVDPIFKEKIENSVNGNQIRHTRQTPSLKLWHINGMLESFSDKRIGFTFHETSSLTSSEINILNQLDLIFVTSQYTKQVFEESGVKNVVYCPIGFDSTHFYNVGGNKLDAVVFGLFGKWESRKNTIRILKLWSKLFGNNKKYRLHCAISNPFIAPEEQQRVILNELGGQIPWNINFLPFVKNNLEYNKILNSIDIDLTGMSSCEGFNLPAFQTLCLGKHGIFLNAHVHKDYADATNSILVEPSGQRDAFDGIFFRNDGLFNCGQWFDFKDDDLCDAMQSSLNLAGTVNKNGQKLKEKFTYKNTVDILLDNIEKLV